MQFEPGTLIDDRYTVERLLGEGGMGAVYAVRDEEGTARALKVVLDATDAVMRKRFVREARAACALVSEHATRVYATGMLEDGAPYMVMELLRGQDLHDHLERNGPLEPAEATDVIRQICDALGEAHELGMVHRDIKPANIFVRRRRDGRLHAKLLDFGVSKPALSEVAPVTQLTQMGMLLGSPHYMPPEQLVSSSDVDPRADIWALAATFHELLTGVGPFPGRTIAEVVSSVLRDEPQPIRQTRPEVSEQLEAVIMRCLEKDREQRMGSIEELVEALDAAQPTPPGPPSSMRPSLPSVSQGEPPPIPQVGARPRGRRWLAAAGLVVALIVAAGAWWALRSGDERPGDAFALSDERLEGDDKLSEGVREKVAAKVRSAFGKLEANKLDEAAQIAADAELLVLDEGIAPGGVPSHLAQDAAFIQARASGGLALVAVQRAKKDDDPLDVIGQVKRLLSLEAEHAERALRWYPSTSRCLLASPAHTLVKVIDEWDVYMKRMDAKRRGVAENYASALKRAARTAFDKAANPSVGGSEACREAADEARRAWAP